MRNAKGVPSLTLGGRRRPPAEGRHPDPRLEIVRAAKEKKQQRKKQDGLYYNIYRLL